MYRYDPSGNLITSRCIDMYEHPTTNISTSHVVLATKSRVYTWDFTDLLAVEQAHRFSTVRRRPSRALTDERWLHAEKKTESSDSAANGGGGGGSSSHGNVFARGNRRPADPIACVGMRGSVLAIVRKSGAVEWHNLGKVGSLSNLPSEDHYTLDCSSAPTSVSLNSDATKMAVLESSGRLTIFDTAASVADDDGAGGAAAGAGATVPGFERSNVWAMLWADDDPEYLAVMERRKRYIFRGVDPEEPSDSCSYISTFSNMEVEAIDLDAIFHLCSKHAQKAALAAGGGGGGGSIASNHAAASPEAFAAELASLLSSSVGTSEIKALRDTRALLASGGGDAGFADTVRWVQENAHPRQWKLLGEAALDLLDLDVADEAFGELNDFSGIQFVQQLRGARTAEERRAQVAEYKATGAMILRGSGSGSGSIADALDASTSSLALAFPSLTGSGSSALGRCSVSSLDVIHDQDESGDDDGGGGGGDVKSDGGSGTAGLVGVALHGGADGDGGDGSNGGNGSNRGGRTLLGAPISGADLRHGHRHRIQGGYRGLGANVGDLLRDGGGGCGTLASPASRRSHEDNAALGEMYLRAGVLRVSRVQQKWE